MTTDVYNRNLKAQAAPNGNSRDTDSRALLACARRLDDAKKLMEANPKSKEFLKTYGDAIRANQRLWTIFYVSLSDPQNPLPNDLKVTLLNLNRYVNRVSFSAVGKYAPDIIDSLININRIIAAGLSKQPVGENVGMPPIDTREIPTSLTTSA
jgi:flagellar protein FlaF